MLWMERVALMFYIIINAFLLGVSYFIGYTSPDFMPNNEDIKDILLLSFVFTILVWIAFRAIDFMFAGPLRREIKKQRKLL